MSAPHVLFFISPPAGERSASVSVNDNSETLPRAFLAAGWQVSTAPHDALHRTVLGLACNGRALSHYDLIWPVGFGPRANFLDWLHLLDELPPRKLINPPSALVMKHGKAAWVERAATTYIAAAPPTLIKAMHEDPGTWVLKPMAGSFGKGVVRLASQDTERLQDEMAKHPGEYFVLQRFLPEIAHGETRTLVVGGQIIGSYLRVPTNALHANLAHQAETQTTKLTSGQSGLIQDIAADMLKQHIGFAAIDLVGEILMEVNIANPGGLGSLAQIYNADFGSLLVRAAEAFIAS